MNYIFYDSWNLILETIDYTNGASEKIEYVWGKDLSGSFQGAGGVGGLLAVSINGVYYYPFSDHNGNITDYVNASGIVVAHYEYDPFGNTIAQSGGMANVFRFRYSTKYYDDETELYYYGRRFYDPVLGRWINRDPIEEDGGLNLYAFCKNDPINKYDYLGLLEQFTLKLNCNQYEMLMHRTVTTNATSEVYKSYGYSVFSGKDCHRNNPKSVAEKDKGPIPTGTYYIVDRPAGGRNFIRNYQRRDWFALFRNDGVIDDQTIINGVTRGNFRMHAGSRSDGCVTFQYSDQFAKVSKILQNTTTSTIPGTTIKYYGTLTVEAGTCKK